jgi:hypothetical protein
MTLIHKLIRDYKQCRLMKECIDEENCNLTNLQMSIQHEKYSNDTRYAPEVTIKKVFIENEDAKKVEAYKSSENHSKNNPVNKNENTDLLELLEKELKESVAQVDAHIPITKEEVAGKSAAKVVNFLVNLNTSLKTSILTVDSLKKNIVDTKLRFDENEVVEILLEYNRRQKEEIRKLVSLNFNGNRSLKFH